MGRAYPWLVIVLGLGSTCFRTARSGPTPRVVNGTPADYGTFPFMTSLRIEGRHSCGATLIAPTWLLTAAHCVRYSSSFDFAWIGGVDLNQPDSFKGFSIQQAILPGDYARNTSGYDLALVQLKDKCDHGLGVGFHDRFIGSNVFRAAKGLGSGHGSGHL
mmetsp:Transcript_17631/g.36579  ORF Transcript_17631/g.36579 Transcript_17631/m.36579 type:complete len:160 (-) Transcript_17631:1853-2332(-)